MHDDNLLIKYAAAVCKLRAYVYLSISAAVKTTLDPAHKQTKIANLSIYVQQSNMSIKQQKQYTHRFADPVMQDLLHIK